MTDETHTVEMNGTELQITETEDSFEVTEVESESEPTVYLRASSGGGDYGVQVPIDAEFDVRYTGVSGNEFTILFDEDDDVSELDSWKADDDKFGQYEFDSGAYVTDFEVVVE